MNSLIFDSPIGRLLISENGGRLCGISFLSCSEPPIQRESRILLEAKMQLTEYFAGIRKGFSLPISIEAGDFALSVYDLLQLIPYGSTRTYSEIAAEAGKPKASRAVGLACHSNPLPIIIPCHRVIGKNGALVGYTSGLTVKKKLLRLEGIIL